MASSADNPDRLILVPSEAYILRKYKGHLPSLIVHLHPTHFRFDQQEGSFSYHSEMRIFIEHLQKRTIPHDMLEELRKSDVRFFDGWLIVRVVDHKSVSAGSGAGSNQSSDDQHSIHNHNPYITPSPWRPFPLKHQLKPDPEVVPGEHRQAPSDGASIRPKNSSSANGHNGLPAASPKSPQVQPKFYHVALRPTALSKHMDVVIDSMTADPKSLTRRQSQAFPTARTPSSMGPPTPLSAVPPTPSFERGPPPNKKLKMKVESKDLLDYEARIVNSTAPPLFLGAAKSFEEAQNLLDFLRDPWHDEAPPSPKERKRTIAELAADDALAKEQERFMLIMDESNTGGAAAANGANADGPVAAALFQPRFEKFNTLENIKQARAESKRQEEEMKAAQDHARRNQQREEDARRARAHEQQQQQQHQQRMEELHRRQQMAQLQASQRQQAMQAAATGQQHPQPPPSQQPQQPSGPKPAIHTPGASSVPPNMQNQMMHASQAQRSSPVVRTSTPHMNSSPLAGHGQMSLAGQSVSMAPTSSNQGAAGSPPRPGSAMQHGHPGAAMARAPSGQGPSRHGTPQVPQGTPAMRHATPAGRQGTPTNRANNTSPHVGGMGAQIGQMPQVGMMNGVNAIPGATPQNHVMPPNRPQGMNQHHAPNFNQPQGNGHGMTPEQLAHYRAQNQAANQQRAMQQQQQLQQQQNGQHPPHFQQQANAAQNSFQQRTANYTTLVHKTRQEMLSNQQFQASGGPSATAGSPPQNATPHQPVGQMNAGQHPPQSGLQPQGPGQPPQRPGQPTNAQYFFAQRFRAVSSQLFQHFANQQYGGNVQLIQPAQREALQQRAKGQVMQEMAQRGMINPQQRQGQMTQQQMMQMQHAQQQAQQHVQQQGQPQGQGQGPAVGPTRAGPRPGHGPGGAIPNTNSQQQNMAFIRQQIMQQQALHQQQQQQQQHHQQQSQMPGMQEPGPGARPMPK